MGGKKEKAQTQTSTQANTPWGPSEPYLKEIMGQGKKLYDGATPGYVNLFPGMSGETEQGLQMLGGYQPGQAVGLGDDYLTKAIRGDFLSPASNPYLQSMLDQQSAQIQAAVNSSTPMGSRTNPSFTRTLANQVGQGAQQLLGENYGRERGLQTQALQFLPQQEQLRQMPAQAKLAVGQYRDDVRAEELAEQQRAQLFPYEMAQKKLMDYMAAVTGATGNYGTSTMTQVNPMYRNKGAGMLGGALSGAQMGAGFGPWGAAIGAIGGGILGSRG